MSEPTNSQGLTRGEKAVGLDFNPSGNPLVQDIKVKAAAFIDALLAIEDQHQADDKDQMNMHLLERAYDDAISAQMFAVKAATWVN